MAPIAVRTCSEGVTSRPCSRRMYQSVCSPVLWRRARHGPRVGARVGATVLSRLRSRGGGGGTAARGPRRGDPLRTLRAPCNKTRPRRSRRRGRQSCSQLLNSPAPRALIKRSGDYRIRYGVSTIRAPSPRPRRPELHWTPEARSPERARAGPSRQEWARSRRVGEGQKTRQAVGVSRTRVQRGTASDP